jgi:ubiquinone/menaquinone biosynthesis C-methylase UbiE
VSASRPRPGRHRARRPLAAAALGALAAAHLADALRARRRLAALPVLPALLPPGREPGGVSGLVTVSSGGAEVPPGVVAAADAYARRQGLDVVDLVPGDLAAEALLALARRTGPDRPAAAPPGSPSGAGYALLVAPRVAARIGLGGEPPDTAGASDTSGTSGPATAGAGGVVTATGPHHLARLSRAAHRSATGGRATVLAPGLAAGAPADATARWARLDAVAEVARPYTSLAAMSVVGRAAHLAALAAGVALSPAAGVVGVAAWWAKPAIAAHGYAADALGAAARRPVAQVADVLGLGRAGLAASRRQAATLAAAPPWPVPRPPARVAPRREACPWCRSGDLAVRVATTDLLQHKPGHFVLDRCRACGHVFQNPQLSPAGLAFYYDQFYDGIGGELMTQLFATGASDNARRIAAVDHALAVTGADVRRWMDVGTGHGHFPRAARERWPDVEFDGVDLSESVEEAARRGWVDHAYRAPFPELADGLGGYDVVTMHHYLEHTTDPVAELDAVAKLLDGGALLEVEVPDPECVMGRLLGRYWLPWLQPQHLHFVPCANLVAALEERNFEVVSTQHDHQAVELVAALALALEDLLPSAQFPWRPPSSPARQLARGCLMTAFLPAFAVAAGLDQVVAKALSGRGRANTYRVVARKL